MQYLKMNKKIILIGLILVLINFGYAIPNGGISYYNLDNITDQWHTYNGVNYGTTSSSSYPSYNLSGNSATSSSYADGSSDYIDISSIYSAFGTTHHAISISAWAKTNGYNWGEFAPGSSRPGIIYSWYYDSNNRWYFTNTNNNDVNFYTEYNGGYPSSSTLIPVSSTTLNNSGWNNIILVSDGSSSKCYINGELVSSLAYPLYTGDSSSFVSLFRRGGTYPDYFDGYIDDVKIYNITLNTTQISNLYNYGNIAGTTTFSLTVNSLSSGASYNNPLLLKGSTTSQAIIKYQHNDSTPIILCSNCTSFDNESETLSNGDYHINITAINSNNSSDIITKLYNITITNETLKRDIWWNVSWYKSKNITISNSNENLTDYQLELNITYDSDMLLDFSDLRFTWYNESSNSEQEIPYWQEESRNGLWSTFWIKIPYLESGSNSVVKVYYDNPDVSSSSSGKDTFLLFDDFDESTYNTSVWTKEGSGTESKETYFYKFISTSVNTQGLTTDGKYFYWGDDTAKVIKKLDYNGNVISSFSGPTHCAGGSYATDRGTIYFSSGGGDIPEVWEINQSSGIALHKWDFSGEGYNRGALVVYTTNNTIYLFTSDSSSNFKIQKYQLYDNLSWISQGYEYNHTSLGVPQGLTYYNGSIYYLYDTGISKLKLNTNGTLEILSTISNFPDGTTEKEGLTHYDDIFYYGSSNKNIYKARLNSSIKFNGVSSTSLYSTASFGINTSLKTRFISYSPSGVSTYPGVGYGNKATNNIVDDSHNGVGIIIGKIHNGNNYFQGREQDESNNEVETTLTSDTNWAKQSRIYEIDRYPNKIRYHDLGSSYDQSSHYPSGNLRAGFGYWLSSGDVFSACDWIFIRKLPSIDLTYSFSSEATGSNTTSSTCSCPSPASNWNINMSNYCSMVSCDTTGYNLTFTGTGTFEINGTVKVSAINDFVNGQTLTLNNGNLSSDLGFTILGATFTIKGGTFQIGG